jgi:hypothetical protein
MKKIVKNLIELALFMEIRDYILNYILNNDY